jgi:hypothetical protein
MNQYLNVLYLSFATLTFASSINADVGRVSLRADVKTFQLQPGDGRTPNRAVFTPDRIPVEVRLTVAAIPDSDSATVAPLLLKSANWWTSLEWDLRRNGVPVVAHPYVVDSQIENRTVEIPRGESPILKAGENAVVRYVFALEPGEYTLQTKLGALSSEPEWFLVSSGNETADLAREFARYKVLFRSRDNASLRMNLMELGSRDPLNAGVWIQLGDIALKEGTLEEAQSHYTNAREALKRRGEANSNRPEVLAGINAYQDLLSELASVLPYYFSRRKELEFRIDEPPGSGMKRYVLRERASGKALRTVKLKKVTDH